MIKDILVSEIEMPKNVSFLGYSVLTQSIKMYGILNPIVVKKVNEKYQIVEGEVRFLAGLSLGMKIVPCYIDSPSKRFKRIFEIFKNKLSLLKDE